MTLKDYYTIPQDWTVTDGAGAQQTMADILTATANQDEYSALRDDFMTAQEARIRADNPAHSALGTAVMVNMRTELRHVAANDAEGRMAA